MREAFGGISLFQIVIIFLLLFAGIIAFSINHSKAFGVKDEMLHILESGKHNINDLENNPLSKETALALAEYLDKAGYSTSGKCEDGWVGYDARGNKGGKTIFCVRATNVGNRFSQNVGKECDKASENCKTMSGITEQEEKNIIRENERTYPSMLYYDISLFYQLDIPLLNDVMNFKLKGSTKLIYGDE